MKKRKVETGGMFYRSINGSECKLVVLCICSVLLDSI